MFRRLPSVTRTYTLFPYPTLCRSFVQRFLHHDFAASRDEFQQAVDLRPNDSDALLNLAVADWNLGNLDAAIKAMRRAIALDPQESGYHYLLGMMLAAAGDFDAARQSKRRALVIDTQNVQAYIPLSNPALLQNDHGSAETGGTTH